MFFFLLIRIEQSFLSSRPLPEVPQQQQHHHQHQQSLDSNNSQDNDCCLFEQQQHNRFGLSISQENLLQLDQQQQQQQQPLQNGQMFVALYDFQSGGENQLSFRKGLLLFSFEDIKFD